jgi:hypothetical protein
MRRKWIIFVFSLSFSFIWFLSGCQGTASKRKHIVVLTLFDVSGSTARKEVRQQYLQDLEKILEEMGEREIAVCGGDKLLSALITENSLATGKFFIDISFPRYSITTKGGEFPWKNKIKKKIEEAKKIAEDVLLRGPSTPRYTDLMNSFQLAAKIFNGEECKNFTYKYLVVFSDMFEQTPRYDFFDEKLTPARIKEIINKERREGRLPNLAGVKVWVAGASAGLKGIPSSKIYQIRDFWLAYFSACGADLTNERYSTTLINFYLPK